MSDYENERDDLEDGGQQGGIEEEGGAEEEGGSREDGEEGDEQGNNEAGAGYGSADEEAE